MVHPKFRISWSIPAPVIIVIIAQAAVTGWVGAVWKTTMEKNMEQDRLAADARFLNVDGRIGVLERSLANNVVIVERVKGVEVKIDGLEKQGIRVEQKLDTVLERRR